MKKPTCFILILTILVFTFFIPCFYSINSNAAAETIVPEFGDSPKIDGYINKTVNEWNGAKKVASRLYSSESKTDVGLLINLWVMQNDSNLYISVQFDLELHNPAEFVGILISKSASEGVNDFVDAKIVQFSNLGRFDQKFDYLDYYIEAGTFIKDKISNGDGAGGLTGATCVYEFQIPVNISEDEDVFLDYGEQYAFKIVYGTTDSNSYPEGILKSNIVLINIQYPPPPPLPPIYEIVLQVLVIVVFCLIGALYGFYIYKIFVLKKKIERIKK